jgi:hypothetical protein
MEAPKCEICLERHWGPKHVWKIDPEVPVTKSKGVTKSNIENVTRLNEVENVTPMDPVDKAVESVEKPAKKRGGPRAGSGRKRVFDSEAEKQKEYRRRAYRRRVSERRGKDA